MECDIANERKSERDTGGKTRYMVKIRLAKGRQRKRERERARQSKRYNARETAKERQRKGDSEKER